MGFLLHIYIISFERDGEVAGEEDANEYIEY